MKITRQDLITLCDNFLTDKIDKTILQNFATDFIISDERDFETDEILSDTLFEWEDEDLNFPINHINVRLWKERLLTGVDKLLYYNDWNSHIDEQQAICSKYNSKWAPINKKLWVAISTNIDTDPINGLRHPRDTGTTGWFIWTGDYSQAEDFFQPICAEHLLQQRPEIIKYLGLEIGFRFLSDKKGYEDVWYDEKIKNV